MRDLRYLCLLIAGTVLLSGSHLRAQTADFAATPTEGCVPLLVQFTNTSSGTISSYSWNLGNGVTSALQNPSTTYTSPGTYTVTLTVTGSGGSNTKTVTNYITVYAPPVISFSGTNLTGCVPLTVPFSSSVTPNAPGAVSYLWNFGDGGTGPGPNPAHTYNTVGTFNVTVTATNGKGCAASTSRLALVTANPRPNASFTTPATVYCHAPATIPFTSGGTAGCTVSWNFGDGSTDTGAAPTHTYNTTGAFNVRMIATNSYGCPDTFTQTINVLKTTNSATYTGPTDICVGATGTFSNSTAGATLPTTWLFGDGGSGYGNSVTYAYAAAGTYPVRMITTTGSCPDTAFGSCTIRPKPVASITMSPSVPCPAPTSVIFTGGAGMPGATYQWSWARGGTATGAVVSHAYTALVTDTVKLVATSPYGCKDSVTYSPIAIRNIVVSKDSIYPRGGCVPLTVSFKGSIRSGAPGFGPYPSTISSVSWDFGDGFNSTALTPVHTYINPGTYIATATVTTANGCTVVDTVHIRVGTPVKPAFHILSDSVCFGSQINAINTTANAGGATFYYTTNTGGYVPAPTQHTDIPVDSIAQLWITLHSINNGCEDTTSLQDSVVVNPPNARFSDTLSCAPNTSVKFVNQSWRATSVWWSFGDGGTSTSFAPTHTYPSRGSYSVRLVAYNNISGCYDTTYRTVTMTAPVLGISCPDTAVCKGDTLHISGHCTPAPASVAWAVDNWIQPGITASRLDSAMGIGFHTITFITTDRSGCIDSVRRPNYVIVSKPTARFGGTPLLGCAPFLMAYTDSSAFTMGTAFGSRTWYFGDATTASGPTLPMPHTYTAPGFYSPTLVVKDFNGCADTLTRLNYVEVRDVVASFVANKTQGCIGEPFVFTNSSSGASAMSFKWDFGDGRTATSAVPSHAYAATGSYTVRLIVTDSVLGCTDTLIRPSYITITRPVASFTLSDSFSICLPAIIQGQSTSLNAASLLWNFGNGSTSTLANPILSFATPGVYNVQLIGINSDGCADTSAPLPVRVLGYKGALTYTPVSGCAPLMVKFKANIANVPHLIWDFADGSTNSTAKDSLVYTYFRPGTYLPRLIFSNNSGCRASSDGLDTIKVDGVKPDFRVTSPCVHGLVQLSDTSTSHFSPINYWQWNFGNGFIATGNKTKRAYGTPGQYPVTLTVRNANGCTDSLTRKFDVYPLPAVHASPDTSLCIPDQLQLWAKGGKSYKWSPGDSLSCHTCAEPWAAPKVPITYVVIGTDSNGCSNRDSVRLDIQPKTTFSVKGGGEICLGEKFQLSAGGATVYHWSPSESLDNADIEAPIASPSTTTTYVVTALEGSCAEGAQTVTVVVDPLPTIDAGKDEYLTIGNSVQLKASGTNLNRVEWDFNTALSCQLCLDPIAAPANTSTFRISGYSNKNCKATDEVIVHMECSESHLFIPNTFTPNGDGLNDYFFPRSEHIKIVKLFRVFDRWGEMLYEKKDYQVNDEYAGWNGTFKGKKLTPDVYVYMVQADCEGGKSLLWKGDVTLMR